MIHGLDTGYLVAAELAEHADHAAARQKMAGLLATADRFAIAPQVVTEFIHVATDRRRLAQPLDLSAAIQIAEQWWTSSEVVQVYPDAHTMSQLFNWLRAFSLGRKRLLDTLLAATYLQAGIHSLLTTNPADFAIFGVFSCVTP